MKLKNGVYISNFESNFFQLYMQQANRLIFIKTLKQFKKLKYNDF